MLFFKKQSIKSYIYVEWLWKNKESIYFEQSVIVKAFFIGCMYAITNNTKMDFG